MLGPCRCSGWWSPEQENTNGDGAPEKRPRVWALISVGSKSHPEGLRPSSLAQFTGAAHSSREGCPGGWKGGCPAALPPAPGGASWRGGGRLRGSGPGRLAQHVCRGLLRALGPASEVTSAGPATAGTAPPAGLAPTQAGGGEPGGWARADHGSGSGKT